MCLLYARSNLTFVAWISIWGKGTEACHIWSQAVRLHWAHQLQRNCFFGTLVHQLKMNAYSVTGILRMFKCWGHPHAFTRLRIWTEVSLNLCFCNSKFWIDQRWKTGYIAGIHLTAQIPLQLSEAPVLPFTFYNKSSSLKMTICTAEH